MTFNKKLLAGLVTLAAASAANATVVVGGDNGFEFSVDGEINQFVVYTSDNLTGGTDSTAVRDGLLPAFLGFNIKAPTTNGLDVAARVSISPGTSSTSRGGSMEQREAFFTVDGSFGQVLAGKALGLYGSHNILTDQTLYGVGWGTGSVLGSGATTTLGRINLGYDYADWRSQVKWTSADMSGFKIALAIVDPSASTSLILAPATQKNARYEADLSYASDFDGGHFMGWLSGMTQDNKAASNNNAWTVGATLNASGFEAMAQYSDSQQGNAVTDANGSLITAIGQPTTAALSAAATTAAGIPAQAALGRKAQWDQYIIQAGYNFGGTTRLVAGYSKYNNKTKNVVNDNALDKDMWTLGIYHDVTANLKLVAEYSRVQSDKTNFTAAQLSTTGLGAVDQDIFSVGGFVSW